MSLALQLAPGSDIFIINYSSLEVIRLGAMSEHAPDKAVKMFFDLPGHYLVMRDKLCYENGIAKPCEHCRRVNSSRCDWCKGTGIKLDTGALDAYVKEHELYRRMGA